MKWNETPTSTPHVRVDALSIMFAGTVSRKNTSRTDWADQKSKSGSEIDALNQDSSQHRRHFFGMNSIMAEDQRTQKAKYQANHPHRLSQRFKFFPGSSLQTR